MKPRPVLISIETTTGVAFDEFKRVRGGRVVLQTGLGYVICELPVEQIQVNVIRQPKSKKLVRT